MGMGELPGRLSNYFGLNDSGMDPRDEAYGMNPRRAYWAATLADLSGLYNKRGFQGAGMQVNKQQQEWVQARQQQQQMDQYRSQMSAAALLNSWKTRDNDTPAMKNAAAMGLKPGTPEYNEYIKTATTHPLVDMSDKSQGKYYDNLLKNLPKVQDDATSAADEIGRVNAMEGLIDNLGRTGTGKDMMVHIDSFANQMGMGWVPDFINKMSTTAGFEKIFTGELGAQELLRALANQDVLARAKELYPVSNNDIRFLQEMQATLGINDPRAMKAIIGRRRQQSQNRIDTYNWYRQTLSGYDGIPPMPEIKPYETQGLTQPPKDTGMRGTPEEIRAYEEVKERLRKQGVDVGD